MNPFAWLGNKVQAFVRNAVLMGFAEGVSILDGKAAIPSDVPAGFLAALPAPVPAEPVSSSSSPIGELPAPAAEPAEVSTRKGRGKAA